MGSQGILLKVKDGVAQNLDGVRLTLMPHSRRPTD